MTTKSFVLNDGTELTLEETLQVLLKRTNDNLNTIKEIQTDLDHILIRLNEHTQDHD